MSDATGPPHRNLLPGSMALLGFVAGFLLLVPLGCTVTESIVEGRGNARTLSSGGATCSNLFGLEYAGGPDYRPPLWPALASGLAGASLAGALTLLAQRGTTPRPLSSRTLGWIGVGLNASWTVFLAGLGLFSSGSLDPQWRTALIFVGLVGLPAAVALAGLRDKPALLLAAGIICVPLSFISLAGATLPLLLPATLYVMSYVRS